MRSARPNLRERQRADQRRREIIPSQYFGKYSSCRTTMMEIVIAQVEGRIQFLLSHVSFLCMPSRERSTTSIIYLFGDHVVPNERVLSLHRSCQHNPTMIENECRKMRNVHPEPRSTICHSMPFACQRSAPQRSVIGSFPILLTVHHLIAHFLPPSVICSHHRTSSCRHMQ
jgi:hypothetical protein